MRVFYGISRYDSYETIKAAVIAIERKAQELQLTPSAWSLAELQPDKDDFTWMCDWMKQLQSGVTSRCLIGQPWHKFEEVDFSYAEGIGLLLLMSAEEIARREASEGSLWSTLQQGYFSDTTKHVLFVQGHPTRAYKDAIELATSRFKLRHVFGMEAMQHWFDTVYLQFGFTRRGFMSRLPEWLAGQAQTQAVQHLLEGKMSSLSFRELWLSLLEYRRKIITQQQLQKRLSNNPWILPEWIEDLVRQASAKPHLGSAERGYSPNVKADEMIERFLDNPVLRWDPPSPPQFICHISNLVNLDLTESTYALVIAGCHRWQLFKRMDGSYKVEPSDEIILPTIAPSLPANLVASDGRVVSSMILELWDENEDVTAFRPSTGNQFDPWKNAPSSDTAFNLLIAPDLTVEPQPQQFYDLRVAKLFFLPRGWSQQTSVLLQSELLWRSDLTSRSVVSRQSIRNAIQISIHESPRKLQFGGKIRLSIAFSGNIEIVSILSGDQLIDFFLQNATKAITEPIAILPGLFAYDGNNKLDLRIRVKSQGRIDPVRSTVDLHIKGAAMWMRDSWVVLDGSAAITVEQGKMQPVKFFLVDTGKWVLLEGDTRVELAQIGKIARPIGSSLTGFGASLTVQEGGEYNVQLHEPLLLAKEVVDYGIIAEIVIDRVGMASRTLSIRLSHSIELDEHYAIVWWDKLGSFHTFNLECDELQENDMWWLSAIPQGLTEPLALAISYDGVRQGARWDANWSRILREMPGKEPLVIAAMLRWFHLPILSNSFRIDVQQFAYGYPAEVLGAWIDDVGVLSGLQHSDSSDGWFSAIRTIFGQWQPDAATAQSIITQLGGDPVKTEWLEVLTNAVWKLLRVSPLLMGRVIQLWIDEICIPQGGMRDTGTLLNLLLFGVAGVTTNEALLRKIESMKAEVAKNKDVDSAFVEKALIQRAISILQGQVVSVADEHNIAAVLNEGAFRRLLSVRILEKITQNIVIRR